MIFKNNALNRPDLLIYFDYYYPYRNKDGSINSDFDEWSGKILDLKNKKNIFDILSLAVIIDSLTMHSKIIYVTVPSHSPNSEECGLQQVVKEVIKIHSGHRVDGTKYLKRYKTIDKLSKGGNRSFDVHVNSINIINPELVKNENIMLLDDVYTTGNSINACSEILYKAGARSVQKVVIGKTNRNKLDKHYILRTKSLVYFDGEGGICLNLALNGEMRAEEINKSIISDNKSIQENRSEIKKIPIKNKDQKSKCNNKKEEYPNQNYNNAGYNSEIGTFFCNAQSTKDNDGDIDRQWFTDLGYSEKNRDYVSDGEWGVFWTVQYWNSKYSFALEDQFTDGDVCVKFIIPFRKINYQKEYNEIFEFVSCLNNMLPYNIFLNQDCLIVVAAEYFIDDREYLLEDEKEFTKLHNDIIIYIELLKKNINKIQTKYYY
ncbi:MAG: hypothetical protein EOM59_12340 [Clostridia bacterium]|nr:hypothetical protein [Clostridia bacterium]